MGGWISSLEARAPHNVVIVAMAHKLARITWAVLSISSCSIRGLRSHNKLSHKSAEEDQPGRTNSQNGVPENLIYETVGHSPPD
jgi:hypothetical protein